MIAASAGLEKEYRFERDVSRLILICVVKNTDP